ncbi:MAG: hypothetical protein GXO87_02160 [Chlorobi bacterium]|nr:hypothetical protein [Chlorobiota bacterium]
MSLFPIIYTSLLIFGGLTVSVVLFSFISYKIKGEKENTASLSRTSVNLAMTPAYQANAVGGSNFVNPVAQRTQIRTAYERKRAEVRLSYLNDVQRSKQRYVSRPVNESGETNAVQSNRSKNRFEIVTTFEREADSQPSFSKQENNYEYSDNSFMNYYSNDSDVYFRPSIRS